MCAHYLLFALFFHSILGFSYWVCLLFLIIFSVLEQEKLYGKSITLADREMVEEKADEILSEARGSDVAFLVVGDPFGYGSCLLFHLIWCLWNASVGFCKILCG